MQEPILQARGLRFSYDGAARALDGVSLDIRAGDRLAVLGPNGAGKSTLFLCLNGVLTPDEGEILLDGAPVGSKERKRLCERVGMVFQNADDQIIASTVAAEVSFGPMNLRLPRDEVTRRVGHALEYMALEPLRARPPHDLSGGEKKRVSIADILAMESEVILFDEPGASLDPAGEERLEAVLARLSDEGKTLVISTHDMDFAFRWATRAAVFAGGRLIADGTPEAVFREDAALCAANLRRPVLLEVFELLRARGFVPERAPCPKTPAALEALLGAGDGKAARTVLEPGARL
ncbi:MAG: ABC transporter ATP-binding protein [Eubacteriales bacterium]|nr:ABC transporter ATP-binding protein [Eubacteriales bacterium]